MKRIIPISISIIYVVVMVLWIPMAIAQTNEEGAQIYSKKCARCHGDDGLGEPGKYPPIAGNPGASDLDYVIDVVTNGLSGKEILGVTYTKEMRGFEGNLSTDEIRMVSEYAVELSVSGPPLNPPTTVPVGEGTADVGDNLFRGSTLLSNNGPACIACHAAGEYDRLGGPGLAIDLNGIVDDYGTAGFVDSITDPIEDGMIAVFGDHPISAQEAADLAAFLETTTAGETDSSIDVLLLLGAFGFLLLILATALVIRGPQQTYVTKLRSTR